MTVEHLPPETLRKATFELVNTCREHLRNGSVDISDVESSVRAYCESVAALPEHERLKHKDDLNTLMELISKLGEELMQARDAVRAEMGKLEQMRKANVAYQISDGITPRHPKQQQDEDGE